MKTVASARARERSRTVLAYALALALTGCAHHGAGPRGEEGVTPTAEQLLQVAEGVEQRGDSLRAQQYLVAALHAGAPEAKVIPRLLKLYIADGQYRVAIDQAEDYLRRQPEDRELRLLLSTLYTAVGEYERAVVEYERVLARAPDDAYAHFALASLLHEQGGAALRADEHFRAYLALEPRGEHAAEARGLLLQGVP